MGGLPYPPHMNEQSEINWIINGDEDTLHHMISRGDHHVLYDNGTSGFGKEDLHITCHYILLHVDHGLYIVWYSKLFMHSYVHI